MKTSRKRFLLLSVTLLALITATLYWLHWRGQQIQPADQPTPRIRLLSIIPSPTWMGYHRNYVERARQGHIDLYFLGDSLTGQWLNVGKNSWDRHFLSWHPANFGIGGDGTHHVLWRIQNGELENVHPKALVLMIGVNNLQFNPAPEIASGIAAIVAEIRKQSPTTKILLLALLPHRFQPTHPLRLKSQQVNALLPALASDPHVKFLDLGHLFLAPDGTLPPTLMPDALHLSPQGYEILANGLTPTLTEWLGNPAP